MRPKNFTERKKRIFTFAGLYAASVILMFFIFSAFGVHWSVGDQTQRAGLQVINQPVAANNDILQADSLLHAKLRLLQQSDDEYSVLPADTSTTRLKRTGLLMASGMYEQALKRAVDSISQTASGYYGDKAATYKTLLNSFAAIISSRQALKNIQSSIASGKTAFSGNQLEMLQWKNEMTEKDNELARVNAALRTMQGKSPAVFRAAGTEEAQKGETELLRTAFNDQQKEYNDVKEKYNRLKTENGNLATQLIEYKKNAATQNDNASTASESRINTLEQKVQDLNADVYFARVDCNLARADAQQIISNARQRKELLSESLAMLNSLAASGDAGIQKRAKDKIIRLNHIATALHD